jgi:hypothetical protein
LLAFNQPFRHRKENRFDVLHHLLQFGIIG